MTGSDAADRIDSLFEPESLTDRPGVTVETETETLPPDHFDHWRERAGLVGVGVTTDAGEVLLWDGPHGWTLPYVEVDAGGDFAAAARDAVETLAGVHLALVGVERFTRTTYRLADGDDSLSVHQVVFRTESVDDATAAEIAAGDDALRWTDDVDDPSVAADHPDDVEDEFDDVRRFLDRYP